MTPPTLHREEEPTQVEETPPPPQRPLGARLQALALPVFLAIVFGFAFRPVMADLADRLNEPAFQHGWIVGPLAIGLAWLRRESLLKAPVKPSLWGYGIIAVGLLLMYGSSWAQLRFVPFVSMLIVICGILVALGGWIWFIRLLFPYALLYSLIPMTDDFIVKLAIPLQSITSVLSSAIGSFIGLDLARSGHMLTLTLGDGSLQYFEVAKACSGLHSLIALMYMGAAIAYLTNAPMWKRAAILLVGIPIAIAANVLRVTGILAVAGWGSLEFAVNHFHDSASPTLFFVSTLAVLGFRNWLIREKPEPPATPAVLTPAPALATAYSDDDDF